MNPFDIRDLPPVGETTLLEASAGTGKTWTIAALVARYVAEGHARLDELLVVTFGRAASQELRERVRERLVGVERALTAASQGEVFEPGDDVLLDLVLAGDRDELLRRGRRVRDALASFDSATIATTHQFCQQVLKSLGVAGDTDTGATLVEDLGDLLLEVVDDLFLRSFAGDEREPPFTRADAVALSRAVVGDPQSRLEPHDAVAGSVARARLDFATSVRTELDIRKRRLGILSYDDLLSQLAEALEHPDSPARRRMQERWKIVLVDEFQDTDPVQWQVLDRAFSGVATMVLIGDPKQAIYAFRGGDVDTYLEAAGSASTRATLPVNFRSDEGLLRGLQTVLGGAELGNPDIVVHDVEAANLGSRLTGAPHLEPFRLRQVTQEQFGVRGNKGVGIAKLREHVAKDLALDVRALLASGATFDGERLEPVQIAVLCATRNQCAVVWSALAETGIPAVISGGGSVFATEGAAQWLTLLEALEQPHRTGRVRAAALTSFIGHTAVELDAEGEQLTDATARLLREWVDLFHERGIAAVAEAATSSGLAARVLARNDGERLLTDLRHTAEALHDAGTREGLSLVALLSWMREQMAEDKLEVSPERTRRLDSDADAVQILTIHGSKGLQFPVVYLPSASDEFGRDSKIPLFHAEDRQRCLDVGGPELSASNKRLAQSEESGERLRLLYVAMTRAQSQVVTWWLPSSRNTAGSSLHRLLFGRAVGFAKVLDSSPLPTDDEASTVFGHWHSAGGPAIEQSTWAVGGVGDLERTTPTLGVREFTREIDQTWRRTSYSGLSSAAAAVVEATTWHVGSEPEDPPRDDEQEITIPEAEPGGLASPMANLPVGATFGSLVHAVLEHADPQAVDLHAELLLHIDEQLDRWPVVLDREVLATALEAVCDSPLGPLAGVTLRELGRAQRMCELDFELPLAGGDRPREVHGTLADLAPLLREHLPDGDPLLPYAAVLDHAAYSAQDLRGYLTGSVDVVLRVGERFLIVDYKTNWLGEREGELTAEDYRPERLAEAMTHSSYPLQALLYAVVLHRFLRWRVPGYDPALHFGGVLYLYVRGMCGPATPTYDGQPCGVFSWLPPIALVEAVSDLLDGVVR